MKKLLLSFAILSFIHVANAQLVYVQGGVNFANISTSENGKTEDNNMLTTFNAGIMARFGLSKTVDLESGLLFTGKGSKAETNFSNNNFVKAKFNPYYIELPLNLVLNIPFQKNAGVFVSAGPYVAVGVAGKTTVNSRIGLIESESKDDIKFSNDDPFTSQQEDAGYGKIKRFDYGVNVGAGLDLDKILVKVNFGLGLAKINSTETNNNADEKNKYRTLSLSLGIPLGR